MVGSHPSSRGTEQRFRPYELTDRRSKPPAPLVDSKLQLREWAQHAESDTENEVEDQILPLAGEEKGTKRARSFSPDSDDDVTQVHKMLATQELSADVREITRLVKKLDPSFPVIRASNVFSPSHEKSACSKTSRRKGTKAVRQRRAALKTGPAFIVEPVADTKMSAKAAGKRAASASMDVSDYELDEEAMHEVERAMGISDHWIPPMKVKRRPKHKTTRGHRSKRHVSQILLHAVAGHLWLEDFRHHQLARKARLEALRAEDQRVAHISFGSVRASWWYPAEYRSTMTPWWIRCAVMPLVWPSTLSLSSLRPMYPAQPQAVFPSPYVRIVRKRNAESAFRFPQIEAPGDEVNERWARRNELRLGEEVVPFANYIEDVLCACREIRYREELQAAMSLSPAGESEQLMLSPPPRYLTPELPRHLRPRCEGRTTMVTPDPPIYIQDIFSTRSPAPPPPYNACTDCEPMVCDVLESPMVAGVYRHLTGARAEALDEAEASYEDEVDTVEAFMAPVSGSIRSLTSSRPTWSAPLTIGAYPPISSLLSPPSLISATPIVSPRPVRATSQHLISQWDHALDLEDQPIFDVEAMFDEQEDQDEQEQREATAGVSSGLRAIGRWLGWRR